MVVPGGTLRRGLHWKRLNHLRFREAAQAFLELEVGSDHFVCSERLFTLEAVFLVV